MEGRQYLLRRRSSSILYTAFVIHCLLCLITIHLSLKFYVINSFSWDHHQQHQHHHGTRTTSYRIPYHDCRIDNHDHRCKSTAKRITSLSSYRNVMAGMNRNPVRPKTPPPSSSPLMETTTAYRQTSLQLLSNTKLSLSSDSTNSNELMSIRQGSTVALITPFHEETGKVDFTSLQNLIQYHMDSGTDNLCLLGTTGEAGVLSMEEREQVLTTAVNMVKGRIPMMVGCGTINPHHVQEMIQQASDCGCDAALVVTPYYVKPPQRSLIKHYTTLADTSPLPLIIYNVPGRTAVDMKDESIAIAASHDNIIGVKDATGKLERLTALQQQLIQQNVKKEDFLLFSGDDETSMEYVLNGGDGCISVTANVAAKVMHDIMMSSLQNDPTTAKALNDPLVLLHQKLFCEANPMPIKYAASKMKYISSPFCRPPLDIMDTKLYGTIVEDALQQAGLLL